jgi:hypothetical protein
MLHLRATIALAVGYIIHKSASLGGSQTFSGPYW